jgi:hypothetical protein
MDITAEDIGLQLYQQGDQDRFLLRWWLYLWETGDIEDLLVKDTRTLYKFLQIFQLPNQLYYILEDNKIWFAAWLEPFYNTAFFNLWVDRSKRGTVLAHKAVDLLYESCFDILPYILGITKHKSLIAVHHKKGYRTVGTLPGLFDGSDAYVMMLKAGELRRS